MSVFSAGIRHRSFYWQISVLCFVLGILLAAAAYTANRIARQGLNSNRIGFDYNYISRVTEDKAEKDSQQIKKLREERDHLLTLLAKRNDGSEALNASMQELRAWAGLTEVTGDGVVVTLTDSKKQPMLGVDPQSYLIHDRDINEVVNELRSAGAEAIAVGNQRVVASTAVRCVGPVAMVNEVKESAPFVIRAIGDRDTLLNSLNITNGVLDGIRRYDPTMAIAEKQARLHLPAFGGSTQVKYVHSIKPASETSKSSKQKESVDSSETDKPDSKKE